MFVLFRRHYSNTVLFWQIFASHRLLTFPLKMFEKVKTLVSHFEIAQAFPKYQLLLMYSWLPTTGKGALYIIGSLSGKSFGVLNIKVFKQIKFHVERKMHLFTV